MAAICLPEIGELDQTARISSFLIELPLIGPANFNLQQDYINDKISAARK
jgi:hypothetical protein